MLQTALESVTPGGRVVQVGLGEETCCVPTMQAVFKEVEFTGSFRYTNTVRCSLCLLAFHCDKRYIYSLELARSAGSHYDTYWCNLSCLFVPKSEL